MNYQRTIEVLLQCKAYSTEIKELEEKIGELRNHYGSFLKDAYIQDYDLDPESDQKLITEEWIMIADEEMGCLHEWDGEGILDPCFSTVLNGTTKN